MGGAAMKLAPADIRVSETEPASVARFGRARTWHLSDSGGLKQFGLHRQTLEPGARSADRHWHDCEDEFLYVLDGVATVVDERGAHDLGPGDAVGWPHGDPNAHCVVNRTDRPCSYLIAGARVAQDVCTYPDSGLRQANTDTTWQVVDAAGAVLRGGDLPPEQLNLPPVWGRPYDGVPPPPILRNEGRVWIDEADSAHPVLGGGLGPFRYCVLGEAAALSQFGVHLESLPPGSRSSFRHWHMSEDEMVVMLDGEVVLVEDTETLLTAGDIACWPAGHPVGHCLSNRSTRPATYLVFGTRKENDTIHYPDDDLVTVKEGAERRYMHADGRTRRRSRVSASVEALHTLQGYLDHMAKAVLSDDFETYERHVSLPFQLVTETASLVVHTLADLESGFDEFVEMLRAQRVTEYIRVAKSAMMSDNQMISGRYETHLLCEGKHVVPSFVSRISLRREDGVWRAVSIVNATRNERWPVAWFKVSDEA